MSEILACAQSTTLNALVCHFAIRKYWSTSETDGYEMQCDWYCFCASNEQQKAFRLWQERCLVTQCIRIARFTLWGGCGSSFFVANNILHSQWQYAGNAIRWLRRCARERANANEKKIYKNSPNNNKMTTMMMMIWLVDALHHAHTHTHARAHQSCH